MIWIYAYRIRQPAKAGAGMRYAYPLWLYFAAIRTTVTEYFGAV